MKKNISYRELFTGLDTQVPLLDGSYRTYINLDNAASTPALKEVQKSVNQFLEYYSSVHRGTGFKSQLSTHVYETARLITLKFLGADPAEHTCIFVKNTTEAVNKLARRFPFTTQRDLVLVSEMEHHSNDLPWRAVVPTVHVALTPDGRLDEHDFDVKLEQYGHRIALVAISGASNVTGFINPIHRLAAKAHRAGAMIFVDCAQLAPHRKIEMRSLTDEEHLDFTALSAHKMYAPFGSGALVGRRDIFEHGDPDQRGGGTVEIVTLEDVVWSAPPEREEAGSPNTVGAVAMAAAICQLEKIGMEAIAAHEAELTAYALKKLSQISGLRLFGETDICRSADRLGVIPMLFTQIPHFLVAAVLGYEFGIGVRSGCFCAHPYILHLMGLSHSEAKAVRDRMLAGDKSEMPGMIRASFGLYNTIEEIDQFTEALEHIGRGEFRGRYVQNRNTGEYTPLDWKINFDRFFSFP